MPPHSPSPFCRHLCSFPIVPVIRKQILASCAQNLTIYLKSNSKRAFSISLCKHSPAHCSSPTKQVSEMLMTKTHFLLIALCKNISLLQLHLLHSKAKVFAVQQFLDTDTSLYQAQLKIRSLTQKPSKQSPGGNSQPASPVVSSVPIPEDPCRHLGKDSTNKIGESAVYQIMEARAGLKGFGISLGVVASSQCHAQS